MDWGHELWTLFRAGLAAAGLVGVLLAPPSRRLFARLADRLSALPMARMLLLAVALTALPRLALLPAFEPKYHADTEEYVEKAATIADTGSPRAQEVRESGLIFYRTLGYALPLAGWYRVTGTRSVLSARVFNVIVACGVAALLVWLGAAAGLDRAGRLAACAYGLLLAHVQFTQLPYTETWASLTSVAAALAYERLRDDAERPRHGWAALLGLSLGALLITRTEFLWLPPLLVLALAAPRRRAPLRLLSAVGITLLGLAVPFAVNHQLRSGYPGHLRTSSQGGLILYFGNNPIDVNGHGNATPEVSAHVRALYREDPTGALARDQALAWMRVHPGAVAANAVKKAYHLWLAPPQGFGWEVSRGEKGGMAPRLSSALRFGAHAQSLAVLALGLVGLWRLRRRPFARAWAVVIAAHLALWCLLATSPRNKLMLEPLLLLPASALVLREGR